MPTKRRLEPKDIGVYVIDKRVEAEGEKKVQKLPPLVERRKEKIRSRRVTNILPVGFNQENLVQPQPILSAPEISENTTQVLPESSGLIVIEPHTQSGIGDISIPEEKKESVSRSDDAIGLQSVDNVDIYMNNPAFRQQIADYVTHLESSRREEEAKEEETVRLLNDFSTQTAAMLADLESPDVSAFDNPAPDIPGPGQPNLPIDGVNFPNRFIPVLPDQNLARRMQITAALAAVYNFVNRNKGNFLTTGAIAAALAYKMLKTPKPIQKKNSIPEKDDTVEDEDVKVETKSTTKSEKTLGSLFSLNPIPIPASAHTKQHRKKTEKIVTPMEMIVQHMVAPPEWTQNRKYKIKMTKVEPVGKSNFKFLSRLAALNKKKKKK